jgi:hypothetical protein
MLRKIIVNGERISNMTLANDAATSSTQGEMHQVLVQLALAT